MTGMRRTSPLTTIAFAVAGIGVGVLLQLVRSSRGLGPIVPPLSLPLTLLVLAAVLLVLGISLRRAVGRKSHKPVNPFHAVRLLAAAKATQFSGALLGGFGGGLALQLLARTVLPPSETWVPMLLVIGAGLIMVIVGVIVELMCQVPPTDNNDNAHDQAEGDFTPGTA